MNVLLVKQMRRAFLPLKEQGHTCQVSNKKAHKAANLLHPEDLAKMEFTGLRDQTSP